MKSLYSFLSRVKFAAQLKSSGSLAKNNSENLLKAFMLRSSGLVAFLLVFGGGVLGQTQHIVVPTGGTAGNTNGTGADPVCRYFNSIRYQVVYTVAELNAAGLTGSSQITSLAWNVTESSASLANYTVKMANVTATNSATHNATATTTVKNAFTYTVAAGYNDIIFDVPFTWDGTSNLLVEICTGTTNPFTTPYGGVQAKTGITSGSRHYRVDGAAACGTNTNTTNTTKPYVRLTKAATTACSGTPAPGNTISSAPSVVPGGTVNLSLQNLTSGTGLTYQWQSGPSSTGPWTNFGTSVASQTSPIINANTWFRCNVTCGGNTGSSSPVQVTLSYCTPSGSGANTSITNVTTSGGITNLANASGFTAGGYANYTAFSCSQSAGGTINFTLTYVSDPGTKIFIDWNNDLDFNDAGENVYSSNGYVLSTVSGSFTVPVGQAVGNYRMRIVADWNATNPVACPVGINGETEDYTFTVAAPPSCVAPTALVGTPLSLTSASISWTAASPAPASGYQYYVSSSSTPPTAGTTPTGTTAAGVLTANLTSLTTGTTYYFWVRSVCSVSDLSSWAGAGSFYVGYCVPVTTYGCTDGDVIARVVLNTLDNNSGTGCPSGLAGYSDYTTNPLLTTTLLPSSTYNCTVYAGQYAEGYAAWIDYNDDGVFDNTTERIGYSNGQVAGSGIVGALGSSASFPITLACTPPAGTHRLRVRAMYFTDGINVTPCTSNFYGEVEDYLITIAPAPACPSPGLISTVTATSSSVTLTWLTSCSSATSYDFEYGPVGFTSGTGTLVSNQTVTITAPNASFTVTGLQAGTNYSIYYRANCGSSTSAWSLVNNFTTLNGVSSASSSPTLCEGTIMTSITHTTQGATGIGTATGLPAGVTASWSANVIAISGTPSASGVFSYSIPLTGGLGTVSATGTITVLAAPTAPVATSPQQFCETSNSTIASIQYSSVSGSSYLWYSTSTGGSSLATTQELTIGTSTYYLEVIGGNGCVSLTRTPVVVTENPLLTASVSITGTTACPGGVLLFTATPVNGGTSPTYQWYNGGVAIPGENQSTYSAVGLAPGDVINVKMVPSGSCVTVCQ